MGDKTASSRPALGGVLAAAFAVVALGLGLFALVFAGLSCDETCEMSPARTADAHWWARPDAMEWKVITGLGVAIAVLGLATAILLVMRRRFGACAFIATVGASVALLILAAQAPQSNDVTLIVWVGTLVGSGLAALNATRTGAA